MITFYVVRVITINHIFDCHHTLLNLWAYYLSFIFMIFTKPILNNPKNSNPLYQNQNHLYISINNYNIMKSLTLSPEQIMTTNDFPVHNEPILKIYFKIAQNHPELLPPTPVIHKSLGLPLLKETNAFSIKHNKEVKTFFEKPPNIEYILCDGSHKTTALTLTHNPINAMLIETDDDIKQFKEMIITGDIFSFACPDSIKEILIDNSKHFSEAEFFQTVKSKTERMVNAQVIPKYMIDFYRK